jgi:hypothetical protein
MSLGDHLRFLRAMKGGVGTATIARAIGLERPWPINEIEVRYRETGADELVGRLAEYLSRPVEELFWHRERSRTMLTRHIQHALQHAQPIVLHLRSGETLSGLPAWWDLGSIGLVVEGEAQLTVVQRHAVIDWG